MVKNGKWAAFIQRFSNQRPLKALYNTEPHIRTFTRRRRSQTHKATNTPDTVTSQPALPHEPHAALTISLISYALMALTPFHTHPFFSFRLNGD